MVVRFQFSYVDFNFSSQPDGMEWWKILLGLLCLFAAFCYQAYQNLSKNLPKPTFDLKEYWGKGKADGYKEDLSIKPFKVDYSAKVRIEIS